MKGILFDFNMAKVILSKIHLGGKNPIIRYRSDWPNPVLRYPNQVLVKTRLGGICVSDLHLLDLDVSYFASIIANPEKRFPMGHEVVGEVIQVGEEVLSLKAGDRVVYLPGAFCEAYGFKSCTSCRMGNMESCYSLAGVGDGSELESLYGGRGRFGGFGGGGYCESLVGFEKQFFKVPEDLSDEQAVLAEPLAVAIHAVSRHMPSDRENVVLIGAGIIGLMVITAIRMLGLKCRLLAVARHSFQREAAERLGTDEVIIESDRDQLYNRIARLTGASLFKPILGRGAVFGNSGPDILYDCVGTEVTIDDALHLIRSNGKIVILGQSYTQTKKVDWSIQTYKEIEISGAFMYGIENINGKRAHAFEFALDFLKHDPERFRGLVTHFFRIDDYKTAIETVRNKARSGVIKAAFDFRINHG